MKQTKTKRKNHKVRDYFSTKELGLPDRFVPGFMADLDKRSRIFQAIRKSFDEAADDLGGAESMSHTHLALLERFCFCEFVIRNVEACILDTPSTEMLTKWIGMAKSLSSLGVRIGLQRERRPVDCLQSYVKSKKKRKS